MSGLSIKFCAQCRNADTRRAADVRVKGKLNGRPYAGSLCLEHRDMLADDGASLRVLQCYNARAEADRLWAVYEAAKAALPAKPSSADKAAVAQYLACDRLAQRAYARWLLVEDRATA